MDGETQELRGLGFDFGEADDRWLDTLRRAQARAHLGSIGPYELIEEVSRGGQGVVFRARQPGTKRIIALKRLLAGRFSTGRMLLRFHREVEAAAALSHPNIVTVYGMEIVDGLPLLAMEWIDGVPVTEWARQQSRDRALATFLKICDAIQHAHERGVLHRDLKPPNILVDAAGEPHVLDFGLAKRTDSERGEAGTELTLSHEGFGTPAYAAPEQLHPGARSDERSDVYSLGVLLFEMLTRSSPYGRWSGVTELVKLVDECDPPRPSSIARRLPRELDVIALKALAKAPNARYSSVAALAADVRRHLAGEPILALPPSSWYQLKKLVSRNRMASAFVLTVLLLSTGFGLYSSWQAERLSAENQRYRDSEERLRQALADAENARALAEWEAQKYQSLMLLLPAWVVQASNKNPQYSPRQIDSGVRSPPLSAGTQDASESR